MLNWLIRRIRPRRRLDITEALRRDHANLQGRKDRDAGGDSGGGQGSGLRLLESRMVPKLVPGPRHYGPGEAIKVDRLPPSRKENPGYEGSVVGLTHSPGETVAVMLYAYGEGEEGKAELIKPAEVQPYLDRGFEFWEVKFPRAPEPLTHFRLVRRREE